MATRLLLVASLSALALAGCNRADSQPPAPAESLVPLPSAQPAPTGPAAGPAAPDPGSAQPTDPAGDDCGADKLGQYLNQLPTSDVMAAIHEVTGPDKVRVINPGDAVTLDFRPDRLNVEVGEDGRIKLFRCG